MSACCLARAVITRIGTAIWSKNEVSLQMIEKRVELENKEIRNKERD